jgi:hypothetical protein
MLGVVKGPEGHHFCFPVRRRFDELGDPPARSVIGQRLDESKIVLHHFVQCTNAICWILLTTDASSCSEETHQLRLEQESHNHSDTLGVGRYWSAFKFAMMTAAFQILPTPDPGSVPCVEFWRLTSQFFFPYLRIRLQVHTTYTISDRLSRSRPGHAHISPPAPMVALEVFWEGVLASILLPAPTGKLHIKASWF